MTCIAGIIDKTGKGHIACDSVGSNRHTKTNFRDKKIFKKDGILFGYTTSYRMGQLLQYQLTIPPRKVKQSLDDWIHIDFVEAFRGMLKSNGFLKIDSNQESAGQFLIILESRLFVCQPDLSILESDEGFDSVGSGEDYALATIHNLVKHTGMGPKDILYEAIDTASWYVTTVGGEITTYRKMEEEPIDRSRIVLELGQNALQIIQLKNQVSELLAERGRLLEILDIKAPAEPAYYRAEE